MLGVLAMNNEMPDEVWVQRVQKERTSGRWWVDAPLNDDDEAESRYVLASRDLERRRALADELEAFMQPRFFREPTLRDVLAYLRGDQGDEK
jgi:hypothetical protein